MQHIDVITAKRAPADADTEGRWDILQLLNGYAVFGRSLNGFHETGLPNKRDAYKLARKLARDFDAEAKETERVSSKPKAPKPVTDAEIERVVTLTTAHLTREDDKLLADLLTPGEGVRLEEVDLPRGFAVPFPCGWMVRLFPRENAPGVEQEELAAEWRGLLQLGFSESFAHLLASLRAANLLYVRFDRDGEPLKGFPTFDW